MGIPDHGDEDAQPDEGLTEEHCDPLEHDNHTLKVASKACEEEEDIIGDEDVFDEVNVPAENGNCYREIIQYLSRNLCTES